MIDKNEILYIRTFLCVGNKNDCFICIGQRTGGTQKFMNRYNEFCTWGAYDNSKNFKSIFAALKYCKENFPDNKVLVDIK